MKQRIEFTESLPGMEVMASYAISRQVSNKDVGGNTKKCSAPFQSL